MDNLRALHVNDIASSPLRLLAAATEAGWPWEFIDRYRRPAGASRAQDAWGAAKWAARLWRTSRHFDLLHVHYGLMARHTRFTRKPYCLHFHGSDARTVQYMPRYRKHIVTAAREALAVFFATPDIRAHALALRSDAIYLPIPIMVDQLPTWQPPTRPRVFFASRWEAVKGLATQLEIARQLRAARPDVELVGLDWGDGAEQARAVGVRTLPQVAPDAFLRDYLARATVVVGQPTGMLATSELEALGIGVPVAAALNPAWYGIAGIPVPPALGGLAAFDDVDGHDMQDLAGPPLAEKTAAALTEQVVAALDDPQATSQRIAGRQWLSEVHDARRGAATIRAAYQRAVADGRLRPAS